MYSEKRYWYRIKVANAGILMIVTIRKEFRYNACSLKLVREIQKVSKQYVCTAICSNYHSAFHSISAWINHSEIIGFMFCVHGITLRRQFQFSSKNDTSTWDNKQCANKFVNMECQINAKYDLQCIETTLWHGGLVIVFNEGSIAIKYTISEDTCKLMDVNKWNLEEFLLLVQLIYTCVEFSGLKPQIQITTQELVIDQNICFS